VIELLNRLGLRKGLDSSILALQQKNERNLLDIFRAATPIMEEIAKVKPETWRSMTGLFTALENTFGIQQIASGALKPLGMVQNQVSNFLEGALSPVMVGINNISNQIESFALANPIGAVAGGIAGGIIGSFLAHPALGALFGSLLGAGIQYLLTNPIDVPPTGPGYYPVDPIVIGQFPPDPAEEQRNRIRNWVNYNAGFAPTLNPVSRSFWNYRIVMDQGLVGIGRQGGR